MKSYLVTILISATLALVGCAGLTAASALSKAESAAWTAANALETGNTASGNVLSTAAINAILTATHNQGDEAVVTAAFNMGNKLIAAQAAAKAANASPTALQNVTTAILSDPNVIAAAAAALK